MSDGSMERAERIVKNRVFIGGISDRIAKEDIEREFGNFGKVILFLLDVLLLTI